MPHGIVWCRPVPLKLNTLILTAVFTYRNGTAAEIELGPISAAICRTVVRHPHRTRAALAQQIASTQ